MSTVPLPESSSPRSTERLLRLRFPGVCQNCRRQIGRGEPALYDSVTRAVRCTTECHYPDEPATVEQDLERGVAGASAMREYERRRVARESRVKARAGNFLGGVLLAITDDPQSTRAWARGSAGEASLGKVLAGLPGVHVLHDRKVPGTRGNIDHVVVSPQGVFVIDAKRYQGLIRFRDVGGLFKREIRLYVGSRDCSSLAAKMEWQVAAVVAALTRAGFTPMPPVTPVLCFVGGEWPLFRPPESFHGVRLEGTRSIRKLFADAPLVDQGSALRIARILSTALPPITS